MSSKNGKKKHCDQHAVLLPAFLQEKTSKIFSTETFHLTIFLFVVLQTSGDGAQGAEQGHERPGEQHEAGAEVQQHHRRGRL
jgi:hypothetical protein